MLSGNQTLVCSVLRKLTPLESSATSVPSAQSLCRFKTLPGQPSCPMPNHTPLFCNHDGGSQRSRMSRMTKPGTHRALQAPQRHERCATSSLCDSAVRALFRYLHNYAETRFSKLIRLRCAVASGTTAAPCEVSPGTAADNHICAF